MKRFLSKALSALMLCSAMAIQADSCDVNCATLKCYKRRSDSRHKYIQLAGSVDRAHKGDPKSTYGMFTLTPGYRGSFKQKEIAKCLFGDHLTGEGDCCDELIKIEGSAVTDRDPKAWLADYFYLPRNYKGSFTVKPRIKTFFLDVDLFVGLDDWLCGLYFRLWGDVVHTSWNLGFCDKPGFEGDTPVDHPHGYFSPANYEGNLLLQSFQDYAKGETPETSTSIGVGTGAVDFPPGPGEIRNETLVFQPLRYAKILKCSKSETGFADLRGEFGWDFWQNDCYHLGFNIQFAAPTGQKKEPCVLFDAMVGNGNHWEAGAGLTGHYNFWKSEDKERHCSFHLDANFTHLFKERVQRTFDLRNKPNSAYMLAAKFGPNTATSPRDQISAGAVNNPPLSRQFAGEYAPVANLSTTSVDVSVGVQADIVAMLHYTCGRFSWDLGYNFWGTSCERMECADSCKNSQSICRQDQQNIWGLKGDARMFGYLGSGVVFPLSATQKGADILNGLNRINPMAQFDAAGDPVDNPLDRNSNVDNPADVFETGIGQLQTILTGSNIQTSDPPCFLDCNNLDFTRIKGTSHTVFTNLSYGWEGDCWAPFMGVGLSAEFGSNSSCCNNDGSNDQAEGLPSILCGPCVTCSVSQWSAWIMGGMTFN